MMADERWSFDTTAALGDWFDEFIGGKIGSCPNAVLKSRQGASRIPLSCGLRG